MVMVKEKHIEGKYSEFLNENLRQAPRFTFQRDNYPELTAENTQEQVRDRDVNVLKLHSQSPDIKHLCRKLKITVH